MNNLLTSPIDIDQEIQEIQIGLYDFLLKRWIADDFDGYGRIFKNKDEKDGEVYPQYHKEGGYKKDVYLNDDSACTFFFIDSDESQTKDGFLYVSDVKCVFMVNFEKILPDSVDRADLKAQRDVIEFLREISPGRFNIVEIQKGISNVFRGFNQVKIKDLDIQPYHCFSINIKLSYNINDKCE